MTATVTKIKTCTIHGVAIEVTKTEFDGMTRYNATAEGGELICVKGRSVADVMKSAKREVRRLTAKNGRLFSLGSTVKYGDGRQGEVVGFTVYRTGRVAYKVIRDGGQRIIDTGVGGKRLPIAA